MRLTLAVDAGAMAVLVLAVAWPDKAQTVVMVGESGFSI
jgi:hypothetical protein